MIKIGNYNDLFAIEHTPLGMLLADSQTEHSQTVRLPSNESESVESHIIESGGPITVFVYYSPTKELLATLKRIPIEVGKFASLTATGMNESGAFFDWGLEKDLFAPNPLLHKSVNIGYNYVVRLVYDEERQKLVGTTKLRRYLKETGNPYMVGKEVRLLIFDKTKLGYKAIVDNEYQGVLFHSDVFNKINIGQSLSGYIKSIREDGKIDLSLQKTGKAGLNELALAILDDLTAHGGISSLTDKSSSDEIFTRFQVSKNSYKKALGSLYKQKKIEIQKDKISLISVK